MAVGSVPLGASHRYLHTCFKSADYKRICHIVAVAYVAHFKAVKVPLVLTYRHKVGKHLARMAKSVRPLIIGIEPYFASASTSDCSKVLIIMPSI